MQAEWNVFSNQLISLKDQLHAEWDRFEEHMAACEGSDVDKVRGHAGNWTVCNFKSIAEIIYYWQYYITVDSEPVLVVTSLKWPTA